jgi:hypothetical protein
MPCKNRSGRAHGGEQNAKQKSPAVHVMALLTHKIPAPYKDKKTCKTFVLHVSRRYIA